MQDEILHICKQLAPVSQATGVVFKMQPYVTSKLNSRAGELAHNKFMEAMDEECHFHKDMLAEEPVRSALELLPADDSDTGY